MSKQSRSGALAFLWESQERSQVNMPEFLFSTRMGRDSIEELESDLVLIPVLTGMKVPRDLYADKPEIAELIKQAIKDNDFRGKLGETLLVETPLRNSSGQPGRRLLLAGLGRPSRFCAGAAESVFEAVVDKACQLNVSRITIPFIPNRGTGSCLNMKGMAHRMNVALNRRLGQQTENVSLAEVQIFCTPQAKPFIEKGLSIPLKDVDCPHC